MWVLAIAVVWFGIEHLVVRWITYLEQTMSAYAGGRDNVRPERIFRRHRQRSASWAKRSHAWPIPSRREVELRESVKQKEALIREVHHRVKNNLQLVMGTSTCMRVVSRIRAESRIRGSARSRINALATLHRRLYESETLQEVDLRWFLEDPDQHRAST